MKERNPRIKCQNKETGRIRYIPKKTIDDPNIGWFRRDFRVIGEGDTPAPITNPIIEPPTEKEQEIAQAKLAPTNVKVIKMGDDNKKEYSDLTVKELEKLTGEKGRKRELYNTYKNQ